MTTSAHAAEPDTRGLFGQQDPTYNGVYRQSASVLGLAAIGVTAPRPAATWLLRQQCADGSFTGYRLDPTQPCPAPDLVSFTGPDTNSTAMAVMALRALSARYAGSVKEARHASAVKGAAQRAAMWLSQQQLSDGGWEWIRGLGSDATSTSMALAAIGRKGTPTSRRGSTWLRSAMSIESDCGVAFQPGRPVDPLLVDPLSTSWTLIGAEGSLPYVRYRGPRTITPCTGAQPGVLAAGTWLAAALIDGGGQIPSPYSPDETDWNSTALATLGLSQSHGSTGALRLGLAALKSNVSAYAESADGDEPAALGTLLMVAHATNANPRDFGGVDLPTRLLATVQRS
ncbi:MAG: hypothetical protein WEA35_01075 [Candidatus Nanopelagicales bacterium]